MAPPIAIRPPPLLAWLHTNEQLRILKLTLLASSIAPPVPTCWRVAVLLPPVAVLLAKILRSGLPAGDDLSCRADWATARRSVHSPRGC